jgi:hypothetical protein
VTVGFEFLSKELGIKKQEELMIFEKGIVLRKMETKKGMPNKPS